MKKKLKLLIWILFMAALICVTLVIFGDVIIKVINVDIENPTGLDQDKYTRRLFIIMELPCLLAEVHLAFSVFKLINYDNTAIAFLPAKIIMLIMDVLVISSYAFFYLADWAVYPVLHKLSVLNFIACWMIMILVAIISCHLYIKMKRRSG